MLRKIACNATNSGCIDNNKQVYVWGSGEYGLLGKVDRVNSVSKPLRLDLTSDENCLNSKDNQSYVVTCISFGQRHAAIVVNDKNTNFEFNQLLYAKSILQEFKEHLLEKWNQWKEASKHENLNNQKQEETKIEETLEKRFKRERQHFPHIPTQVLKEYMVNKAKINFKDTVSFNRLFKDLADPEDEQKVNLKELRDQLIGRRCGNGIVFCWGVFNDGRLGIKSEKLEKMERKSLKDPSATSVLSPPTKVKFEIPSIIIKKVSCGSTFTLALSTEGLVYSWGSGKGLGLGKFEKQETPKQLSVTKNGADFTNISDICCGSKHSLALENSGLVFSWGDGQGGRLGHGDETGENLPKEIMAFRDKKCKQIEAGDSTSAAITLKNELLAWGVGLHGRLGTGQTNNVLSPKIIEDLKDQKVEDITMGTSNAFCLLRNGKSLCWGSSKDGKLGVEIPEGRNFEQPKEMITLGPHKVFQFAAGPFHSLILTEKGDILSFGNPKYGKLGYDESNSIVYIPRKIVTDIKFFQRGSVNDKRAQFNELFEDYGEYFTLKTENNQAGACEIIQSQCGFSHTVFLLNNGQLYTCGSNKYGQLGLKERGEEEDREDGDDREDKDDKEEKKEEYNYAGNNQDKDDVLPLELRKKLKMLKEQEDVETPKPITIQYDGIPMSIRYIAVGYYHVFAITDQGNTFGWGRNDFGQLGLGRIPQVSKPTIVKSLLDKKIVMVAAGQKHSLFLNDMGEVLACGFNEFGELGVGIQAQDVYHEKGGLQQKKKEKDMDFEREKFLIDQNHKSQIDSRIELTPKILKQLESIGYIAVGKNHSVAIRSYKTTEEQMKMYTWGCGWHGQTGQGDWKNDHTPKLVSSPNLRDSKFMMAACGSRHTIALDTAGNIWYFGEKQQVGIKDSNEEKQLVPSRLETPKINEPFKYISAGEEHNLAITRKGIIYGFGKNDFSKINSMKQDLIYFERVETEEKGKMVYCGANHSVIINQKGEPFTWGNTLNGRCGLPLDQEGNKNSESISNPTVIFELKLLFQSQSKFLKPKPSGQNKDQYAGDQNDKFGIQRVLKEQAQALEEENLMKRDRQLEHDFNKLVENFHLLIKENNERYLNSFYDAQNAVISRIYTFPSKIEQLTDIKAELPKWIIMGKKRFEKIFTLLQIHPCYLINWITRTSMTNKEAVKVLKIVFGDRQILNDERTINILMIISYQVLHAEIEGNDFKDIMHGKKDSNFMQIFQLIFENQETNKDFVHQLISMIVKSLQKFIGKKFKEDGKDSSRGKKSKFQNESPSKKNKKYQYFDYEGQLEEHRKFAEREKALIEFMKKMLDKIKEFLDPQLKTKSNNATLSNQIFTLISQIRLDLKSMKFKKEDIDSFVLRLITEQLIKTLKDLTFEKIQDLYWKSKKEPNPEILNCTQKKNLIAQFTFHLEKYIKNDGNQMSENVSNFIKFKNQDPKDINYRKVISKLLKQSFFKLDFTLIKDMFINSMKFENPSLNISVRDLIYVYNQLQEGKLENVIIKNHEEDPLLLQMEKLEEKLNEANIKINTSESSAKNKVLNFRMNLEIKSRILIKESVITKCRDCNGPVFKKLIPAQRFDEAIQFNNQYSQGVNWRCNNDMCKHYNGPHIIKCLRCGQIRKLKEDELAHDQVFHKFFEQEIPMNDDQIHDYEVDIFQKTLFIIPIVWKHQKLDTIIDEEFNTEANKKYSDYEKMRILDEFRNLKGKYQQKYKQKNKSKDYQNMTKAEEQIEEKFLNLLEERVRDKFESKREHDNLLKENFKLIREIKNKMSSYTQKCTSLSEEFKFLIGRVYTGMGSDFLEQQREEIFAGRLHSKTLRQGLSNQGTGNQNKQNSQLDSYYQTIQKQNNQVSNLQQKEFLKSSFSFFGKYPLYVLRQRRVIHNVQIQGKKLQTIIKKCSYVFYDDGDNGFKIDLVYEEQNKKLFVCGKVKHDAILETFYIDKHRVAEIRRVFATKQSIKFGNSESEFNQFELIHLLNEIRSKIYSYGVLADADAKKLKIGGIVGTQVDSQI